MSLCLLIKATIGGNILRSRFINGSKAACTRFLPGVMADKRRVLYTIRVYFQGRGVGVVTEGDGYDGGIGCRKECPGQAFPTRLALQRIVFQHVTFLSGLQPKYCTTVKYCSMYSTTAVGLPSQVDQACCPAQSCESKMRESLKGGPCWQSKVRPQR